MPRITKSDIEDMRQRGYDPETIAKAEIELQRGKLAEEICIQIEEAFADTVLGDGIGLWEAQGLDDYEDESTCAAYRERDEKFDWKSFSLETLQRCNSSPGFFDADGFRFHLPAFMIADLREDYGFDFIYSLIYFEHLGYTRFVSLTPPQRAAVRSYLIFERDSPYDNFDTPDIQKALDRYWTEKSCST